MEKLLEVKDLKTYFYSEEGEAKAVDGVSFKVDKGETIGLVGESGCGKSVTSLSIMRLIPNPPGKIVGGEIIFNGQNLISLDEKEMRKIRGNEISMIFQEPMTSLNPVFTIGDQISEAIMLHQKPITKKEAREKTIEMLKLVGIPIPEQRVDEYPHQLSGGMRQRIMIAMALSCNPSLLIADEPTTALDVTIQAQILELLNELQEKLKMGVILITHNLGVVAETADNVAVMYAGKIIEYSDVKTIFANAQHPYTKGLLGSVPKLNAKAEGRAERLATIDGVVPAATDFPSYCRFAPRCKYKFDKCEQDEPPLFEIDKNHKVACFLMQK